MAMKKEQTLEQMEDELKELEQKLKEKKIALKAKRIESFPKLLVALVKPYIVTIDEKGKEVYPSYDVLKKMVNDIEKNPNLEVKKYYEDLIKKYTENNTPNIQNKVKKKDNNIEKAEEENSDDDYGCFEDEDDDYGYVEDESEGK